MARGWIWTQRLGLLLCGLLLGWTVGNQTKPIALWIGGFGQLQTSTLGVAALGIAVGVLAATAGRTAWSTFWASRERSAWTTFSNSTLAGFTFVAFAVLVALVDAGVREEMIDIGRASFGLALAMLALLFGGALLSALQRGESIEFENHWGGLGGGVAGWRVSPTGIALIFLLIFIASGVAMLAPQPAQSSKPTPTASAKPVPPGPKG
ncbi:hypothetical protein [Caulobacter sp. FWC2]|uniref:hypothetical protein n=1 Tax=Caulobacter sp. FWC2 TaxID=69664 RepID=UPI000C14BCF4|nr:hypothetical protein [Caulobacter sp. FWC2]PIB90504.1 hypothetical protein CSW62_02325 [Caulobacter sp. FWC2]